MRPSGIVPGKRAHALRPNVKPRRDCPGLSCLGRRFDAVFSGDRLGELFPDGLDRELIRKGILRDIGISSTITHCICELARPRCVVHIDRDSSGGCVDINEREHSLPD
jgi:hypothetical protein